MIKADIWLTAEEVEVLLAALNEFVYECDCEICAPTLDAARTARYALEQYEERKKGFCS